MEKRNRNLMVGAFTIIGAALFIFAIFFIGSNKNIFTPTFHLKAYFENVAGLQTGTNVTFAGISVGTVQEINIVNPHQIEVVMRIKSSVKEYVRRDSKVSIVSEGLVGSKIMEISAGSLSELEVDDFSIIQSVRPVSTEDIMKSLKQSTDNSIKITQDLADISGKINRGEGTIGALLNNDSLYRSINIVLGNFATYSVQLKSLFNNVDNAVNNIAGDLDRMIANLNISVNNIGDITTKLNSNQSFVGTLLTDTTVANNLKSTIANINQTAKNLENGAFSFNQNMEALKHNFFFKGYFEDIGYWHKDEFEMEYDKRLVQIRDAKNKLDSLNKVIELKQKETNK